ncbi:hypothetical protein [Nocardioides speluncae]|uniref:hypothetical protein n=1 Tax=Nocardioides speluncae TaxID=2670337 RepID=UPI000D68993C|nr:hypothetical protein [Nocardioides speluncae]
MASTTERGYGNEHQKMRAQIKRDVVDPGLGYCWRCGRWIDPAKPWDLGHDDHDRSTYRGPECRPCNRGTRRRDRQERRPPRRWVL